MGSNLRETIYKQFLDIVRGRSDGTCYQYNQCDFSQFTEGPYDTILNIIDTSCDECGRVSKTSIFIDYTNICYEDLCCPEWIAYLERKASELLARICRRPAELDCKSCSGCRPKPATWKPCPGKIIRYVPCEEQPIELNPPRQIIEQKCPCSSECDPCRRTIRPRHTFFCLGSPVNQ